MASRGASDHTAGVRPACSQRLLCGFGVPPPAPSPLSAQALSSSAPRSLPPPQPMAPQKQGQKCPLPAQSHPSRGSETCEAGKEGLKKGPALIPPPPIRQPFFGGNRSNPRLVRVWVGLGQVRETAEQATLPQHCGALSQSLSPFRVQLALREGAAGRPTWLQGREAAFPWPFLS